MDRPNFHYTRYQYGVDGSWKKLGEGVFSTRARTLRGIANACVKGVGTINRERDIFLAYGYPFYDDYGLVRVIYCPVNQFIEGFDCTDNDKTPDYLEAKSRCMDYVEGQF